MKIQSIYFNRNNEFRTTGVTNGIFFLKQKVMMFFFDTSVVKLNSLYHHGKYGILYFSYL